MRTRHWTTATTKNIVNEIQEGAGQPVESFWALIEASCFIELRPSLTSATKDAMSYPTDCTWAVGCRAWFDRIESDLTCNSAM